MALLFTLAFLGALTPNPAPVLSAMRVTPVDGGVIITLQVSSPVTPSETRLLENPWRLYLDLPGVVPGRQRSLPVRVDGVQQVRAALNQPALTRVVIDLESRMEWEVARVGDGEIQIRLRRPRAAAPVIDRRQQITADARALAPAFEAIRNGNGPTEPELAAMLRALDELSTGARAMQSSGLQSDQMLVAAIDAMTNATRARMLAVADNQPQSRANAIAAASGALLLLGQLR